MIRTILTGAALMAALLVSTAAEAQNYPGILEQISPTPTVYMQGSTLDDPAPPGIDFETSAVGEAAGFGDVTAAVEYVPDDGTLTPGCEATDFMGFTAGNIALIDRGACAFSAKINNAADAGASAVIIANTFPSGSGGLFPMGMTDPTTIPAVQVRFDLGQELIGITAPLEMRVAVIPEPSTLALCGLGLLALLGMRRRR